MAAIVEGQTEAAFVEQVLNRHLEHFGTYVMPIIVKTSRPAGGPARRGGGTTWKHYRTDIRNALKGTQFTAVTTLIDFYGYPQDAPAHGCTSTHASRDCVRDTAKAMRGDINNRRLRPYVLLHEFETLVLASSLEQTHVLGHAPLAKCLQNVCATTSNDVELINDAPQTCPSRRILGCYPGYRKIRDGVAAVDAVGIPHLKQYCPGFSAWVDWLEMP